MPWNLRRIQKTNMAIDKNLQFIISNWKQQQQQQQQQRNNHVSIAENECSYLVLFNCETKYRNDSI